MNRWPRMKLGEIATVHMGQSPPGETYNTNGIGLPFFQGKAEFGEDYPTQVKWCSQPSRIAEAGDILLSVRAPVGPTNYAAERCCIGRGLAAIRNESNKCNQRYIRYYLKRFEADISARGVGSTFTAINRNDLERLELPVPPLAELERIVKLLDEADELRKLRGQADRRTADLIPALFHEMFYDKQGGGHSWPQTTLADLSSRVVDCPHATPTYAASETLYACVRSSDLQEGKLVWSSTKYVDESEYAHRAKSLAPRSGDVVFCREGARLGNAALVTDEKKICLGQRMMLFRVEPDIATPEFLCALLLSSEIQKMIWNLVGGSASPHLNVGDVKKFVTALPPLPLQEDFAARVAEIRAIESQQAASRRRLDDLFQSMLHRAFQGEL